MALNLRELGGDLGFQGQALVKGLAADGQDVAQQGGQVEGPVGVGGPGKNHELTDHVGGAAGIPAGCAASFAPRVPGGNPG